MSGYIVVSQDYREEVSDSLQVLHSLKDVPLNEDDTFVIYHSSNDDISEVVSSLISLQDIVEDLYYVNNEVDIGTSLAFRAFDRVTLSDEYYLHFPDDLLMGVSSKGMDLSSALDSRLDVLRGLVSDIKSGIEGRDSFYLSKITEAINGIEDEYTEINKLVDDTTKFLVDTLKDRDALSKQTEDTFKVFQDNIQDIEAKKLGSSDSISIFTSYRFKLNRPVLVVKEISPCWGLTTFLLGFQEWLVSQQIAARLFIIDGGPRDELTKARYPEPDYFILDTDTYTRHQAGVAKRVLVHKPLKQVWDEVLKPEEKMFIILDRTVNSPKPIFTGNSVTTMYAFRSKGDMLKHGKVESESFIPLDKSNEWGILYLLQYGTDKVSRIEKLLELNDTKYRKLLEKVKV